MSRYASASDMPGGAVITLRVIKLLTGQRPVAAYLVPALDGSGNAIWPERAGDDRPGGSEDLGGGRRL